MTPDQDAVRAARRIAAVHRRRRYPDRRACAACLWPWKQSQTPLGRPSAGCASRLRALAVLDDAGLLDEYGRPVTPDRPDTRDRPANPDEPRIPDTSDGR